MDGRMYEAPPGSNAEWIRCPDEAGYPKRVLAITERLRDTQAPLNSKPSFVLFARSYDQIDFFRARAY